MSIYNDLLDSYYRAWFRFHPETAVELGVEGYSNTLTPYGDDDIGALITLNEKLIDAIDGLNRSELTEDQNIDLQLMMGSALIESKQLIDADWRIKDPTRFIPVNAIYQLTIRPIKHRKAALQSRLGEIPHYLRGAKAHLSSEPRSIPPIWLESAITEAQQGVEYLRSLTVHPIVEPFRLISEIDDAAHALDDFAKFMEKDLVKLANGDFACGPEMFEMLLNFRHGLNSDADTIYKFGKELFDSTWQDLCNITESITGNQDVAALTAKIQNQFRPDGNLLGHYKTTMQSAYEFVKANDLVSLPKQQFLHIVDTPGFLRHQIPLAAYMDPLPTDESQTGYYYVTPPVDEASWGEHNLISLQHTCVHEAWPGHHLQFVTANQQPVSSSWPRLVNASASLYEGWALYCEQLMFEQGFLNQAESEFVLLKDRLWRAMRVMIDVDLHVNHISAEECIKNMQEKLGFSEAQARGDVTWYTQYPTVPLGYAVGWSLINKTRDRLQSMETDFSLKGFHDRLLSSGSIGLPWVLRHNFGEPLWNSVQESVFKPSTRSS
ncbi:hypothetical protein MNBD_GAMMA21-2566 [hydrothermal vent metagenome]|uniref:Uncharacterized protein n=1 Tax=hydrothermal vent metagenome TaxID=652676 RepID=A0A3B0ZN65_9ZZZZ